ncbi:HDOD domain-containing protein [Sulfurimonas sp. MAG313]|nr:HDOD domain-containing protein [Sulfurimonas sp. MAG313]MDF1881110.1 HDOD domain-containing protein [Sulfurimonas sp. MAG313]
MAKAVDYMDDALFQELFTMFKDQCLSQLPLMINNINELHFSQGYKQRIDELFRMFHNYKASTAYLGLGNMNELVSKVENVLNGLRGLSAIHDEGIHLWLHKVKDQFCLWVEEMEDATVLSEYNKDLNINIKVTAVNESPAKKLRSLSCLYIDDNKKRASIIVSALDKTMASVAFGKSKESLDSYIEGTTPAITIVNLEKEDIKPYQDYIQKHLDAAFIFILNKPSHRLLLQLSEKGITHILNNPIKGKDLKRELISVVHTNFLKRRILITNKKIHAFINTLEPLPNTVMQIQSICDDEESSIADLIEVVKKDSIIVGMILNAASNPMYGLKKGMDSIDKAISTFGKKTVKALSFGIMSQCMGKLNLDAYQIQEKQFSKVGTLRLSLMNLWYKNVDMSKLGILSSSAILGNLGQLLISSELHNLQLEAKFIELTQSIGYKAAEEELLHTNCTYVSSDILSSWHLKKDLIDAIRYSSSPQDAPLEIKPLAIANFIVYALVDSDASISNSLSEEIYTLMKEEGLALEPLEEALKSIQKLSLS